MAKSKWTKRHKKQVLKMAQGYSKWCKSELGKMITGEKTKKKSTQNAQSFSATVLHASEFGTDEKGFYLLLDSTAKALKNKPVNSTDGKKIGTVTDAYLEEGKLIIEGKMDKDFFWSRIIPTMDVSKK